MIPLALDEIIRHAISRALQGLFISCPAQVLEWNSVTQLAKVLPCSTGEIYDENGDSTRLPLSPINDVPVYFLGSGGCAITMRVNPGDSGWLVFAGRSIANWIDNGLCRMIPEDPRSHSPSDAFLILGVRAIPNALPVSMFDATKVTIGLNVGTISTPVARSDKSDANWSTLQKAFATWAAATDPEIALQKVIAEMPIVSTASGALQTRELA